MEAEGHDRKFTVCLCEAFGTALFIYGIMINGADNAGVAASLFASVLIFGGVTGGHFNPAVTLGVYFAEADFFGNLIFMLGIIISQCAGGMLAIGMAYLSLFDQSTMKETEKWTPVICPKPLLPGDKPVECDGKDGNFNLNLNTLINEIVCTFIFISVILMIKGKHTAPTTDGIAGAVGVVATLMGMIKTGMRLGACFNPAVGLTLILNQFLWLENTNGYLTHYWYAYIGGPAVAGVLAGIFHLMHAKAFEKEEDKTHQNIRGFTDEKKGLMVNDYD